MEAMMERGGTYRPAGFGRAFMEQWRLLWVSRRPLLMMVGLLGVLALAGEPWSDSSMTRLFTPWAVWLLVIGPFWAFAVWHNEGPSNRLYFWSHPVARSSHTLARFAAGAAWLVLLMAALLLAGLLFAAFEGELAQIGLVDAAAWVNFFAAPLLTYAVISALTVPSDYPIRWFLALLFGIPITLSLLVEWLGQEGLVRTLLRPLGEEWGLGPTLVTPFGLAMNRLSATLSGDEAAALRDPLFDMGVWWLAMPLWLLFWVGVVALLSRHHPDTLPRLRRSG